MKCRGLHPIPRNSHATSAYNNLMIIHGGEGFYENKTLDNAILQNDFELFSSTIYEGNPNQPKLPSKTLPGQLLGVCPGDTLQGLKLGPAAKVSSDKCFYL